MNKFALAGAVALGLSTSAFAQGGPVPDQLGGPGTVVTQQPNTTGNGRDLVIAPGATFDDASALPDAGTCWSRPYAGVQLDRGLHVPLVVEDPKETGDYDQELAPAPPTCDPDSGSGSG